MWFHTCLPTPFNASPSASTLPVGPFPSTGCKTLLQILEPSWDSRALKSTQESWLQVSIQPVRDPPEIQAHSLQARPPISPALHHLIPLYFPLGAWHRQHTFDPQYIPSPTPTPMSSFSDSPTSIRFNSALWWSQDFK